MFRYISGPRLLQLNFNTIVQWNLDLTKSLGTGQICSLNGGFVISRFFSIHFTVTLAGTYKLYRSLYRGLR